MQNTCIHCNHWEPAAPVVQNKKDYGECNKLSHVESDMDPDFIIPVLNGGKPIAKGTNPFEFITTADFGCNQFAQA